ncbi:Oidioi.mRNA.OKI2018_I69.PAR.g11132.t1.cds [Oikopleura dioica]|uniref:Oidioi.mRNA.OKI2018_I69.PAR.g11132.t1.cds n=1 Tax=Oikopleura dioica TaxID=34765 RepID=A0ABN7RXR4_OIKDI|nr:Oidioi.mRNA.OKI2018_I69.PAR.g11132.t1.cds [Oikopleura dioica]
MKRAKILIFLFFAQIQAYDYRWEIARCQNETIRAEKEREMFFVSPSFPNINNAQFDCTWRLQAPEGMRVKIRWPVFHLDSCGSKNMLNMPGDQSSRVIVFDGKAETAFDEEIFCGKNTPPPFISTSRDLHIRLMQPLQEHGKGVKIMCGFTATKMPSSNIRARPNSGEMAKTPVRHSNRPIQKPMPNVENQNRAPAFVEENSVEVVGVEQGRFPDSYYYDYEIQLERKQKILNNLKMKEEERRKSTLSYKFSAMDKQDQWALIGAALCLVVILLVVSYMLYLRRKRLADDISVENRHSLDKRLRSTEKPAL